MLMMDFIDRLLSSEILMTGCFLFFAYALVFLLIFIFNLEAERIDGIPLRTRRSARETSAHASVITLLDEDVLECPICCEPLKIPIFQCVNGHLACTPCWKKVNNICPSCQKPVSSEFRCRAMEKVIEVARVACPNAKYGCKEIISYANITCHEKLCHFAQFLCPMSDCNYTGLSKDLCNHVRASHNDVSSRFKRRFFRNMKKKN